MPSVVVASIVDHRARRGRWSDAVQNPCRLVTRARLVVPSRARAGDEVTLVRKARRDAGGPTNAARDAHEQRRPIILAVLADDPIAKFKLERIDATLSRLHHVAGGRPLDTGTLQLSHYLGHAQVDPYPTADSRTHEAAWWVVGPIAAGVILRFGRATGRPAAIRRRHRLLKADLPGILSDHLDPRVAGVLLLPTDGKCLPGKHVH